MLSLQLGMAGFDVLKATDGAAALHTAKTEDPSLTVLDVMMPGMTGLEVCQALKGNLETASIAVVLLSARAQEADRIIGLEMGADDYLTKPISPRELLLRIEAILGLRRPDRTASTFLQVGDISINQEEHRILSKGRSVDLTVSEFKLLRALMESCGRVLTRGALLDRVWGVEASIELRTVDTHLRRLREKLGEAGGQIRTIRGFGYRLEHV